MITRELKEAFTSTGPPEMRYIQTAGPNMLVKCQIGMLKMLVQGTNNQTVPIILTGVLMSRALSANLISLSAMTKQGYTARFTEESGILTTPDNQKIWMERDT